MAQQKHHSIEFQDQACALVTGQGYTQKRAAKELGVTTVTLRAWLKKRGLLPPVLLVEPDYVASDDPKLLKARIRELENRLRRSEMEKEILKKATGRGLALSRPTSRARVREVCVDRGASGIVRSLDHV